MKGDRGAEGHRLGKPQWQSMLTYVADLHEKSTHPPRYPFPHPWEEIGPGYCYGPAFGHWDIVHAVLDALPSRPQHARNQILNNLAAQQDDGLVPGAIWLRDEKPRWDSKRGHPPLWPVAVQDYADLVGSDGLIHQCYGSLIRQIGWFEAFRRADDVGFYYVDILTRQWESGVDEGVRFHETQPGRFACVDATAHVYTLYELAAAWSETVGRSPDQYLQKADVLRDFMQNELYCADTGFFHDIWSAKEPSNRRLAFEGMWPMVVGAATPEQANSVIDDHLLNTERVYSQHPICTVGLRDPLFELRMWRGPVWNSMTYWAARGCIRNSRPDAARSLLERALDASADHFDRTGTIWEFYHPHCGHPEELQRKPHTEFNAPCHDYLGHNPLLAMARMLDGVGQQQESLGGLERVRDKGAKRAQ